MRPEHSSGGEATAWGRRRPIIFLSCCLVLGHLVLALAYSTINPLGEAPDEADHWAYIVFLAQERRLPEGPAMTQSKHPPFYHATAAVVAALAEPSFGFLRANPDVQIRSAPGWSPNFFIHTSLESWPWRDGPLSFHLARLWSVLLSTATVAAAFGLVRTAFPEDPTLALAATGVLAFLPQFAFIGGAASNDNAAALFGTLCLWAGLAIYRSGGRFRPGWWAPLALGCGLLSKVSTVALWPAVGLAILLGGMQRGAVERPGQPIALRLARLPWRRLVGTGLWAFGPAMFLAAPWFGRNWLLYGDPLGLDLARQTVDQRVLAWTWADTLWLLRGWFLSFWGRFGGAGHIPMPGWIYTLLGGLVLVSGAGWVRLFARSSRRHAGSVAVLALAAVGTMAVIWRYSLLALGTDQGRLLYPAVAALVTLFVQGLLAWPRAGQRRNAALALVVLTAILGVYGLAGVIRPAYAPPQQPARAELAALPGVEPLHYGEISLAGWSLAEEPALYWQAVEKPSRDWRAALRIVAEDGSLVWEWKRSPGRGLWSTDHWPPGTVVRDVYEIVWPDWAGPGRYQVEIGLQPFGEGWVVPTRAGEPATSPQHPYALLGWLVR